MSKCHKCAKWFPHNWLCLRGLSYVFIALFYLTIAFGIFQVIAVLSQFGFAMAWRPLLQFVVSVLVIATLCLTVAKSLQALRAIKHAVAPCCCEGKKEETK